MENRCGSLKTQLKVAYTQKPVEYIPMIIRAETRCTVCGQHETLYIDEKTRHTVEHHCSECGNDIFEIRYKC